MKGVPMNARAILAYYGVLSETEGDEVTFCCPFHGESNPSLSFNTHKNIFHCFTCEASGNVLDFVRRMEGSGSNLQAAEKIAEILRGAERVLQPTISDEEKERRIARKKALAFYQSLPVIDWLKIASSYLYQRGFTPELLRACGVKYNANSIYALVIPLVEQGQFYGYVTRRIDQVRNRKYLNNRGYPRSEVLVGNLTKGPVLVVEGILDRLKAVQYGYTNTTALLNWKISETQARKLAAVATEVICGLDNDEKGQRGYEYICSVMRPYGTAVSRFPFPPDVKDICETSRKEFLLAMRNVQQNLIQKVL